MAQLQPQTMQPPYLVHPTAPIQPMPPNKSTPLPQHKGPLNTINSLYNGTILQTGRLFRSANIRRNRNDPSINLRAAMLADAESLQQQMSSMIPQFHNAVDDLEEEIVRARAVIMRDLREARKKEAERNMTAQDREEVNKKEQRKVVERGMENEIEKKVEKEIEQAADAMVDVAAVAARMSEERKDGQTNDHVDLDVKMDIGQAAAKQGRQTDIISIGDTTVTDSSVVMAEMWNNEKSKLGNAQQQHHTQFPNSSGPPRPSSQSPAIPQHISQAQHMHLMQPRQAMAQQQPPRQPQPPPHTPMQQSRTMPEDNIAFSALPGSTTNSPGKPKRSPVAVLPPPSHHVATQQGGLNIPAESLPLLPEHLRSQMAQVQTQAVLEGKGQQPGGAQASHPHVHPEFFASNSPPGGTPPRNFTPPPSFQPPQNQHQNTPNPSQSHPNQLSLVPPFGGQPAQAQTQAQQNPDQAHDNIDFDAMFAADAGGNHDLNAADGDINFDDFFNDIVGDAAAQNSGDNAHANNQISGLEGTNEADVADFDLASFGLDDGNANPAGNNDALVSMGDSHMQGSDHQIANANANAAVGLSLGMLDGLEQYANQATDGDPMDGLDFPDLPMDNNPNMDLNGETQHGEQQVNTSTSLPAANDGESGAQAQEQAQEFDMGNMQMSNDDLDAAMNSMDQGTSFDDLLDGLYNDGGGGLDAGGEGNGGGGETSEFDDAFFNM